jgi:purine-nucleoside phosphorylase
MLLPEPLARFQPQLALVLGSGLASFTDELSPTARIPFSDLGLPPSSVPGHAGELILASIGATRLAIFSGRIHLYEGHPAHVVTAPIRIAAAAGVSRLVLTNAAGSLHPGFPPGQWMMLSDHLNLTGQSPLTGGPRFHDMSAVYSPRWRKQFAATAAAAAFPLHEGVYAGLPGPQYETPAEIRMLRTLGADAVGMSTVLEAIEARAHQVETIAFSCLTNWAAGIAGPLDHSEVTATGKASAAGFARLLASSLA